VHTTQHYMVSFIYFMAQDYYTMSFIVASYKHQCSSVHHYENNRSHKEKPVLGTLQNLRIQAVQSLAKVLLPEWSNYLLDS